MNPIFQVIAYAESIQEPKRLSVEQDGNIVATVYVDGEIRFSGLRGMNVTELKNLIVMAENFWLFYNNVEQVTSVFP